MERKQRVHFNSFMTDVHKRIHAVKNKQVRDPNTTKSAPFDPIKPVAEDISQNYWLICFDEFQVRVNGFSFVLTTLISAYTSFRSPTSQTR
jgi:peroxisome-assembly ATPase